MLAFYKLLIIILRLKYWPWYLIYMLVYSKPLTLTLMIIISKVVTYISADILSKLFCYHLTFKHFNTGILYLSRYSPNTFRFSFDSVTLFLCWYSPNSLGHLTTKISTFAPYGVFTLAFLAKKLHETESEGVCWTTKCDLSSITKWDKNQSKCYKTFFVRNLQIFIII